MLKLKMYKIKLVLPKCSLAQLYSIYDKHFHRILLGFTAWKQLPDRAPWYKRKMIKSVIFFNLEYSLSVFDPHKHQTNASSKSINSPCYLSPIALFVSRHRHQYHTHLCTIQIRRRSQRMLPEIFPVEAPSGRQQS